MKNLVNLKIKIQKHREEKFGVNRGSLYQNQEHFVDPGQSVYMLTIVQNNPHGRNKTHLHFARRRHLRDVRNIFSALLQLELQNYPVCFSAGGLFDLDLASFRTVSLN